MQAKAAAVRLAATLILLTPSLALAAADRYRHGDRVESLRSEGTSQRALPGDSDLSLPFSVQTSGDAAINDELVSTELRDGIALDGRAQTAVQVTRMGEKVVVAMEGLSNGTEPRVVGERVFAAIERANALAAMDAEAGSAVTFRSWGEIGRSVLHSLQAWGTHGLDRVERTRKVMELRIDAQKDAWHQQGRDMESGGDVFEGYKQRLSDQVARLDGELQEARRRYESAKKLRPEMTAGILAKGAELEAKIQRKSSELLAAGIELADINRRNEIFKKETLASIEGARDIMARIKVNASRDQLARLQEEIDNKFSATNRMVSKIYTTVKEQKANTEARLELALSPATEQKAQTGADDARRRAEALQAKWDAPASSGIQDMFGSFFKTAGIVLFFAIIGLLFFFKVKGTMGILGGVVFLVAAVGGAIYANRGKTAAPPPPATAMESAVPATPAPRMRPIITGEAVGEIVHHVTDAAGRVGGAVADAARATEAAVGDAASKALELARQTAERAAPYVGTALAQAKLAQEKAIEQMKAAEEKLHGIADQSAERLANSKPVVIGGLLAQSKAWSDSLAPEGPVRQMLLAVKTERNLLKEELVGAEGAEKERMERRQGEMREIFARLRTIADAYEIRVTSANSLMRDAVRILESGAPAVPDWMQTFAKMANDTNKSLAGRLDDMRAEAAKALPWSRYKIEEAVAAAQAAQAADGQAGSGISDIIQWFKDKWRNFQESRRIAAIEAKRQKLRSALAESVKRWEAGEGGLDLAVSNFEADVAGDEKRIAAKDQQIKTESTQLAGAKATERADAAKEHALALVDLNADLARLQKKLAGDKEKLEAMKRRRDAHKLDVKAKKAEFEDLIGEIKDSATYEDVAAAERELTSAFSRSNQQFTEAAEDIRGMHSDAKGKLGRAVSDDVAQARDLRAAERDAAAAELLKK